MALNANVREQIERAAHILRWVAAGRYPRNAGVPAGGGRPRVAKAVHDELLDLAQSLEALAKVERRKAGQSPASGSRSHADPIAKAAVHSIAGAKTTPSDARDNS